MDLAQFDLDPFEVKNVPVGTVFGRLTVLATGLRTGTYRSYAVCRCECGTPPKATRIDGLRRGAVVSCGCYQSEVSSTHGLTGDPLIWRWKHMVRRCTDPDDQAFPNYGGRGITVCERWMDARNFVEDMRPGYSAGLELDRIDNDGHYEPGNVRWATRSQNADNRRTRHLMTLNGRTQSLRRWAEETGLNEGTLWERVVVWHWDDERALTTPPLTADERMARARKARWG